MQVSPKILLAHPGTQHSYKLARELECRRLLGEFWTGLALAEGSAGTFLVRGVRRVPGLTGLGSRVVQGVSGSRIKTLPCGELQALWRLRRGGEPDVVLHRRNERFQLAVPQASLARSSGVIGFDTSGWVLADRSRHLGLPFYLDRTIGHPAAFARLIHEFGRRYPEWVGPESMRPAAVVSAEAAEHGIACKIVVGGTYARDTLVAEGIDTTKIRVNPYGVEWGRFESHPAVGSPSTRPLRFLFVGSVSARKGVPVLLDAWRKIAPRDAELWLAGHVGARESSLIPALPGLRVLGHVPNAEIALLYAQCDVFVLPSLFEGFGLVILEALAAGLPVISTPHTGAVDAVTQASLGHVVEAGSVEALAEAMRRYLVAPPTRSLVKSAARPLRDVFSWDAYGDRWAAVLQEPT